MASSSAPRNLSFLALLITISLSLSTSSRILLPSFPDSNSDQKVSLGVYCEAMCPFCSRFYKDYLYDLISDPELFSIVDLYIAPWGQTQILSNGTWDCVHGPDECLLNTVEACAINAWPKLDDHYPFIRCVERYVYESLYNRTPNHWKKCFRELGLDPKTIGDCINNGKGRELELQYAAKTFALKPPIYYVPWIVVDGHPISDYPNYISHICKAYKGTNLPKACKELSTKLRRNIGMKKAPICYEKTIMGSASEDEVESIIIKRRCRHSPHFMSNLIILLCIFSWDYCKLSLPKCLSHHQVPICYPMLFKKN